MMTSAEVRQLVRDEVRAAIRATPTTATVSGVDPLTVSIPGRGDVHITVAEGDDWSMIAEGDRVSVVDTGFGFELREALSSSAGEVPVGGSILWTLPTPWPSNYVEHDGSGTVTVNGEVFPIDDYRNRYVIGASDTVAVGATLGSLQHDHGIPDGGDHDHGGSTLNSDADRRGVTEAGNNNETFASHDHPIDPSSDHNHTGSTDPNADNRPPSRGARLLIRVS